MTISGVPFSPIVQAGGLAQNYVPVFDVKPPPEGTMAVPISLNLGPTGKNGLSFAQSFTLGFGSATLPLSQIVSLVIDNSANPYPLLVTHGALNQSLTISPFTEAVVATFSSGKTYSLQAAIPANSSVNVNVNIYFLNYERQPYVEQFIQSTPSNFLANVAQPSTLIAVSQLNASGTGVTQIAGSGNYIVTGLSVQYKAETNLAGLSEVILNLQFGSTNFYFFDLFTNQGAATQWISSNNPGVVSFPVGVVGPRGNVINANITTFVNWSLVLLYINIWGNNLP